MIAGVVLAAGASSRMGRPKALLPIDGRPAGERVAATLRSGGCDPVVVVVGRHAAEIRAGADLTACTVVDHAGWAAGRTSSLAAGLGALPGGVTAAVLALVDMPYVRAATVRALVAAAALASRPEVVVPVHGGRSGHPVLLHAALFPAIRALPGDTPLRELLRTRRRLDLPVDDPGVLVDLDTPDDLPPPGTS